MNASGLHEACRWARRARFVAIIALVAVAAVDLQAQPAVDLWPEGTHTNPALQMEVVVCGGHTPLSGWYRVTINDNDVTNAFTPAPTFGTVCTMLSGTVTLAVGMNTVYAEFEDTQGEFGGAYAFPSHVLPVVSAGPKAVPFTSTSAAVDTALVTVANAGAYETQYTLVPVCSGTASSCSAPSSVTVAPFGAMNVPVTFTSGAVSTTGTVKLRATAAGVSIVRDSGWYNITAQAPPKVALTPENAVLHARRGAGAQYSVTITNPRKTGRTFTLSSACTGSASCTSGSVSPSVTTVGAGAASTLVVTFAASGATGAAGSLSIMAVDQSDGTNSDTASVAVAVVPDAPLAERGECLIFGAGTGVTFECADLRIVHATPPAITAGIPRVPQLTYSSQQASPYLLFSVPVTVPGGGPLPDSVRATVTIGAVSNSRGWVGTQWGSAGATRVVSVGFDAINLATGHHAYTLVVRRFSGGTGTVISTTSALAAVVNRKDSPFGAGWWVAGWEQLIAVNDSTRLWVGGDGSLRRYERAGTLDGRTVFLARPSARLDSLLWDPETKEWTRLLAAGGRVRFDSLGFHRFTTNRIGMSTEFTKDGSGRLSTISYPPTGASLRHRLTYAGSGKLSAVILDTASVAFRTMGVTVTSGNLVSITDPASQPVTFSYSGNRVTSRTNRSGATSVFRYNEGQRLRDARLPLTVGDSAIHAFCPAETRGLAACSATASIADSVYSQYDGPRSDSADVVAVWVNERGAAIKLRDAYGSVTQLDRGDLRFPAVLTRVVAANGRRTGASYDMRGNVAQVVDSSFVVGGKYQSTRYRWDQRWDQLLWLVPALGDSTRFGVDTANGNRLWQEDSRGTSHRVSFAYLTSGANAGLIRAVIFPDGARDSLTRDVRGNVTETRSPLGWRTLSVRDRIGRTIVTRTPTDSAKWRDDSVTFNARGLIERTVAYGPALNGAPEQRLIATQVFDAEGRLESLSRTLNPDPGSVGVLTTGWTYDLAGRVRTNVASDGVADSMWYDHSGNLTKTRTRRGHVILAVYDRHNRLVRQVSDPVTYPQRFQSLSNLKLRNSRDEHQYPYFGVVNDSLRLLGDTAVFAYDVVGNILRADNGDARIRRTYLPNGLLATDTIKILSYGTRDSTKHVYGIAHQYDLLGRRVRLIHPRQLAPRTTTGLVRDTTRYAYTAHHELESVYDPLGTDADVLANRFRFSYDARGNRILLEMPGGIRDSSVFDADARLVLNRVLNGSTAPSKFSDAVLRHTEVEYADAFRVLRSRNSVAVRDTTEVRYSGLGYVVRSAVRMPATTIFGLQGQLSSVERLTLDALGNLRVVADTNTGQASHGWRQGISGQSMVYAPAFGQPPTGRLRVRNGPGVREEKFEYDAAGNTVFQHTGHTGFSMWQDRAAFYDALNRLRVAEVRRAIDDSDMTYYDLWDWFLTHEEYRYDALGRRVMVRTQRWCRESDTTSVNPQECHSATLRRTVWDGNRELHEVQQPGHRNDAASTMDNDTLPVNRPLMLIHEGWDPNPQFGSVTYTYGPGVDRPLSVIRGAFVDRRYPYSSGYAFPHFAVVPHWTWRGGADLGTFGNGGATHCHATQTDRCAKVDWRKQMHAFALAAPNFDAGWFGTLLVDKEDGTGTYYRRNRYVDGETGRFTQEDPIGLAGGLNLYGYANGDPINLSDPFGLTPYVQCRVIKGIFAAGYSHCAVRVRNEALGIDVMFELIPQGGKNAVLWRHGSDAAFGVAGSRYYAEQWVEVQRPDGMSDEDFDRAVLDAALQERQAVQDSTYSEDGSANSNRFVYNVLKKAGSRPPGAAEKGTGAPGLCGGKGLDTGTDCSKP